MELWIPNSLRAQVTNCTPRNMPAGVINAERGMLALAPGEYAILQLQFRIGNGVNIRKDYEALFCVHGLSLPLFAPWNGESPNMLELRVRELWDLPTRSPYGIHTFFDEGVVREYYQEALEKGDRAFVESHHGRVRADEWEKRSNLMMEHAKTLLQYAEECGQGPFGLEEILKQCEKAGVSDPARLLGIIRGGRMPEERRYGPMVDDGSRSW